MKPFKLLAALSLFTAAIYAQSIDVTGAYVREVPPNMPNSAAFMTLANHSDAPVSLLSATANVSNVVELHEHVNVDGMMQMRQIPKIDIPAQGATVLQPGGLHVMLIGLKQKLKAGEQVPVTLNFSNGETVTIEAPVKKIAGMMKANGGKGKCSSMKCGMGKCGK